MHHENALGIATCGSTADEPLSRDAGEVDCPDCLNILGRRIDLDMRERTRVRHIWKKGRPGGPYCGQPVDRFTRYHGAGSFCRACVKAASAEGIELLDKDIQPAPASGDTEPDAPPANKDWWE